MTQNDLLSDDEINELFTFHERFAPILSRFILKELKITPLLSLSSVEVERRSPSSDCHQIYFCTHSGFKTVLLGIPRSFVLGVVDFSLGCSQFNPDEVVDSWSDIDENLAIPFAGRLLEIFSGYCGGSSTADGTSLVLSPDSAFRTCHIWYTVKWLIEIEKKSFVFTFYIPRSSFWDFRSKTRSEEQMRKSDDEDMLSYIEMRRASSRKLYDSEELLSQEKESAMLTLRVQIGSFNLKRTIIDSMKSGDVLATDISSDSSFHLLINGQLVCDVIPGEKNGNKAVIAK